MKKYLTVYSFMRHTGMTYQEVRAAIEAGTLETIKARAGHLKICTSSINNEILAERAVKQ